MSLFRAAPRAPERRDIFSSHAILTNWEGWGNASGRAVTTESALRLASLYGCISLIADSLSTTPIDVYRKRSDGRRQLLDTPPLLMRPSGQMTTVEWLFALFSSVLLRGNAYGLRDNYDGLGYPREIHLWHPDEVSVQERSRDDPEPVYRFGGEVVPRERVFHLKGFTLPGALEGVSPVWAFAQSIGMGLAAGEYGASFYGSGGHPTAVLETDQRLDGPNGAVAVKALKERIREVFRTNKREPMVLGLGTRWKPIQIPPHESLFLDSIRATAIEICQIYKVPPSMIGVAIEGTSLTYSNREQDLIHLQTMALQPWAVRLEQMLFRELPGQQFVKFNMDAAVRADLTTRYNAHAVGIGSGFLTVNEARELEDRPPIAEPEPPPPPPDPEEDDADE